MRFAVFLGELARHTASWGPQGLAAHVLLLLHVSIKRFATHLAMLIHASPFIVVKWLMIVSAILVGTGHPNCTAQTSGNAADAEDSAADVQRQATAVKQEQYDVAERLLKDFPDNFDAFRIMGYVHSSHGNLSKMASCWEKCRELKPDRADIYDQLGRYAMQTEDFRGALKYWGRTLELDSKFPGTYERIGSAYLNLGEPANAKTALERQRKLTPDSSQACFLLGEAYFQLQDFETAKARFADAVRLQANHSQAYYGLMKCCARLRQTDEMQRYAQRFQDLEQVAIEQDAAYRKQFDDLQNMRSKLANTLIDAGALYLSRKDLGRSEALWKRAADVDPTNSNSRDKLAALYTKQRKPGAAADQFRELIKLRPKTLTYREKLGFIQAGLKDFAGAESTFRSMITIAPKKADGYRALAKFYLNTRQKREVALRLAESGIKLGPTADGYFVLGWASAANGKTNQARSALSRAIQLAPNNKMYRQMLAAVEKQAGK